MQKFFSLLRFIFTFSSGAAICIQSILLLFRHNHYYLFEVGKEFNISLAVREDSKEKPNHSWLCKMENGCCVSLSSI